MAVTRLMLTHTIKDQSVTCGVHVSCNLSVAASRLVPPLVIYYKGMFSQGEVFLWANRRKKRIQ